MEHIFEKQGLGQSPYTYLFCQDTGKASTSCQYCGTGIRYQYWLKSKDGRQFFVGSDCIYKSGDAGLISKVKQLKSEQAKQKRIAKNQAKAEARQAEYQNRKQLRKVQWLEQNPDCVELLNWAQAQNGFAKNLFDSFEQWGTLSEKQISCLKDSYHNSLKAKTPVNCPTGKIQIEGKIIKVVNTAQTSWGESIKMIVETEEGYRVMGTIPKSLDNANRNDIVKFIATVTPSEKDPTFGFFSRPTQATIV